MTADIIPYLICVGFVLTFILNTIHTVIILLAIHTVEKKLDALLERGQP